VREVLDTFRVAARLGTSSLAAYVISMSQAASDVLAVELLQKEARMMVRGRCTVLDCSGGREMGKLARLGGGGM
jgi:phosphoenolpyruvate carboxylase